MKPERTSMQTAWLTPPQVARRLSISAQKVIHWLETGELRGCNLATKTGGRPRYRIAESDFAEFLTRRSASVAPPSPRRRKKSPGSVIEFFS